VGETEITGLDIAFEIEKDLNPEPNSCHVEIYNLSANNRATLSKYDRVPVLLKAGYKDHVGVIFQGDMLSCSHIKEGPNWKTVLASGDGVNAIQNARISKSYTKGTPLKTVIEDLAQHLRLPSGNLLRGVQDLNEKLTRGFTVSGSPMKELCKLLESQELAVSVQDQSLQIIKKGGAIQKTAISLSPESGLLSTPEVGSNGLITIQTMLMAEMRPGKQVHINSSAFTGLATIQWIRFDGSNFGESWAAEIVGSS